MNIILQILADILHITKALIICQMYLGLEVRSNSRIRYSISIVLSIIASLCLIFSENINVDLVIYILSSILILYLCFKCNFVKMIICGIWTILIIEGIGMMMMLSFDVLRISFNINNEVFVDF